MTSVCATIGATKPVEAAPGTIRGDLGMMIGRLGCLLGGLEDNTFGIATSLPWGIDLGDGVSRHPTNLYEIAWLGVTWGALVFLESKVALVNGGRFKLFMISYLVFRLFAECIKPLPPLALGLSSIQWACILGLLYYFPAWSRPRSLVVGSTRMIGSDA